MLHVMFRAVEMGILPLGQGIITHLSSSLHYVHAGCMHQEGANVAAGTAHPIFVLGVGFVSIKIELDLTDLTDFRQWLPLLVACSLSVWWFCGRCWWRCLWWWWWEENRLWWRWSDGLEGWCRCWCWLLVAGEMTMMMVMMSECLASQSCRFYF